MHPLRDITLERFGVRSNDLRSKIILLPLLRVTLKNSWIYSTLRYYFLNHVVE